MLCMFINVVNWGNQNKWYGDFGVFIICDFSTLFVLLKKVTWAFRVNISNSYIFFPDNYQIWPCISGQINTTAAKETASHLMDVDKIYLTSSEDSAYRIMTGTSNRERQVFYPLSAHYFRGVRDFLPGVIERLGLTMFNADGLAEVMKKSSSV